MATRERLTIVNHSHYILMHGHNGDSAFRAPEDCQYFLSLLFNHKAKFDIELQAWCLLENEAHLMVCPRRDMQDLSDFMKHVNTRYSRYFNQRYQHHGTLWCGPFGSAVVQPGHWRLLCTRFIERLPVDKEIARSLRHYKWSSWHHRSRGDERLDPDEDFLSLGDTLEDRLFPFRKYTEMEIEPGIEEMIRTRARRRQFIGDNDYADEIERLTGRRILLRGPGRPRRKDREG